MKPITYLDNWKAVRDHLHYDTLTTVIGGAPMAGGHEVIIHVGGRGSVQHHEAITRMIAKIPEVWDLQSDLIDLLDCVNSGAELTKIRDIAKQINNTHWGDQ